MVYRIAGGLFFLLLGITELIPGANVAGMGVVLAVLALVAGIALLAGV